MKKAWIPALLLLGAHWAGGQDFQFYETKFSTQIEAQLAAGELRDTRAAWEYTYIGKVKEAIDVYAYDVEDRWGFDTLTADQIGYFRTFQPIDAVEEILRRARGERIVIINESHVLPLHRHFTKQLLAGLREAGFGYFGLEALTNCQALPEGFPCDTSLNERGYPLNAYNSGTYIRDPQMSNLIREAHTLGYRLFAYEKFGEERDYHQARYIARVLEQDPDAKILVLCGFGHNIEVVDEETSIFGGKLMAYQVKQMTGIDPLTINQYILSEAKEGREAPLYRMINEPRPSVFINSEGKLFSGWPGKDDRFDMLVYHPRTQYAHGRPTWLINEPGNVLVNVDKSAVKIGYPIVVKAYLPEETNETVAIDIIEWKNEEDDTRLVLPRGRYRLQFENPNGAVQIQPLVVD